MQIRSLFVCLPLVGILLVRAACGEQPITFMKDAGYCWYQDPRAIIANGKLVVGGISGTNGDIRASVYDLRKNRPVGVSVLRSRFQRDDHNAPVFYVRPDGCLLAMYAAHAAERVHYYRISEKDDWLAWGEEKTFEHDYAGNTGITYMNLYAMKKSGLLYNFFRDGLNFNPSFITSADNGDTWGNRTHFIADEVDGRHRPYPRYAKIDEDTVGITFTDGHPRRFGNNIYYAEFRDGSFSRADGSEIRNLSEGPLLTSEAEKIYRGSGLHISNQHGKSVPNSAWTACIAVDEKNKPRLGYTVYLSNDDHRYRIAQWTGKQWIDREIAYGGNCLYENESSYTGLLALDPSDPMVAYISTDVNPTTGKDTGKKHQLYKGTLDPTDDTSLIAWAAVTENSPRRNIRPMLVCGEGYKVLIWLRGPWKSYVEYACDIVGLVLDRPATE